jgi:hypothetical protein
MLEQQLTHKSHPHPAQSAMFLGGLQKNAGTTLAHIHEWYRLTESNATKVSLGLTQPTYTCHFSSVTRLPIPLPNGKARGFAYQETFGFPS